jgi:hypothetical protein
MRLLLRDMLRGILRSKFELEIRYIVRVQRYLEEWIVRIFASVDHRDGWSV